MGSGAGEAERWPLHEADGLMAILRWIVLGVCSLWGMDGVILMFGSGAGFSPTNLALSWLINFGPLALSLLWIFVAARRTSN